MDLMTAIGGALSTLKQVIDMNEKIKDTQVKVMLSTVYSDLADVRVKLSAVEIENQDLKREIHELKHIKEIVEFKNGLYFRTDIKVFCCPKCYEKDNKIITLQRSTEYMGDGLVFYCPICSDQYPYVDGGNNSGFA